MKETWRPIPGWEGYYEVSNTGRIRSVDRFIGGPYGLVKRRGQEMHRSANRNGYLYTMGSREGEQKRIWVHRAVLEAFVGPRLPRQVCLHGNDNPSDNRVENLRWGTQKENIIECVSRGRQANARKTHCKRGHPLDSGNLVPHHLRNGKRACLACFKTTQKYPSTRFEESFIQEQADARYRALFL